VSPPSQEPTTPMPSHPSGPTDHPFSQGTGSSAGISQKAATQALAAQSRISLRTAYKWLSRFRAAERSGTGGSTEVFRRTARGTLVRQQLSGCRTCGTGCTLPPHFRQGFLLVRPSPPWSAHEGAWVGTTEEPLTPNVCFRRYQWEARDMIHCDNQKGLARFERVGHRITGTVVKASSEVPATKRCTSRSTTPPPGLRRSAG